MTRSDWSLRHPGALLGATALAPLTVRSLLLIESKLDFRWGDATGFLADLAISLLAAVGLAALARTGRCSRWAGAALAGLWSLLNFANYEHIRELGSIVNLSYAGYAADPTFFLGSALRPTHPVLLVLIVAASAGLAFFALSGDRPFKVRSAAAAAVVLVAVAALVPRTTEISSWRQSDLATAQVGRLIGGSHRHAGAGSGSAPGLVTRDLSGSPIIELGSPARNVLLILLEGVSGSYLPSLRALHGRASSVTMPELDRIARSGLSWSTFLTTQRQTNRGEYAILCGEYPKLLTAEARMTELAGGDRLPCLPAALADAGFSTHYLQAAPMPFMLKDQFMPRAGFDEALGDEHFKRAYNRNHWGVDDRSFFEASLDKIEELRGDAEPWFLTLLTVGTHHRYNVPPDFEGVSEPGSQAWAFEYLDLAIGEFISQLEARGVLEDTLVLITSDESQAMEAGAPDAANMLTQGWGFLVALTPGRESGLVSEVFTQPDLPISILDYLGSAAGGSLTGRSVFRSYSLPRDMFWGNTHLRMVAGLSAGGRLTVCTEDFSSCLSAETSGRTLFSPTLQPRAASSVDVDWLRTAALQSLTEPQPARTRRIELISPGPHPVVETSSEQYVFGGQFVSMSAHSRADVEMVMRLRGDAGWIEFTHNFMVDLRPHLTRSGRLEAGQTLSLSYSVGTDFDLENLECRLWITAFEGEGLSVSFETAELVITPLPASEPAGGTVEHTFSISASD